MMFFSGVCSPQRGVERRRLARAGRAGDEDRAVGLAEGVLEKRAGRSRSTMPRRSRSTTAPSLSRMRITAASPPTSGSVATRMSTWRPSTSATMRPSCGRAALGDVELGHDLDARDDARDHAGAGSRVASDEHAVDAEADERARRWSGSKWMSEAPCSTPCATSEWTSLTTGASSADSRRSTTSEPVVARRPPRRGRRRSGSGAR